MKRFAPIFIASLFFSLHFGALLFLNSSLLKQFFGPDTVSFLFLVGALGNILLFLSAPTLIKKFGKRLLLLFSLILIAVSTVTLALATTALVVAISFIIYASLVYMIFYYFDIFLEELSLDTKTGEIRGAYIALIHFGLIAGLLVLTFLAVDNTFKPVYLIAAGLLIFPILLALFSFKSQSPEWHRLHHRHELQLFKSWWKIKSVRRVTLARLALEFFYTSMIIYTPLYLHGVLGFEWNVIGVMFIVMLLPFILFQWPVGMLADYFIGEKEFMIIGFLIMGVSLLFMPYLETSVILWTLLLFCSRMVASFIEITTDSYFFKHVDARDTGFLSIFRLARPVSVVLVAIFGAVTLNIFSFEKIFFVIAVVVFFGLKQSLSLRDTK